MADVSARLTLHQPRRLHALAATPGARTSAKTAAVVNLEILAREALKEIAMSQAHNHMNHATWVCKYHVVFMPRTKFASGCVHSGTSESPSPRVWCSLCATTQHHDSPWGSFWASPRWRSRRSPVGGEGNRGGGAIGVYGRQDP
jgi:hypothetical protein